MKNDLCETIDRIVKESKKASLQLQDVSARKINLCLKTMSRLLKSEQKTLITANRKDLNAARKKGISAAMIDRLTLTEKTIDKMSKSLIEVATLAFPVGREYDHRERPNGLVIFKKQVPIGVICIIYESRPNVTVDAAAICLKSGNSVILRGGSEAFHSNVAIAKLFGTALLDSGLPVTAVQIVPVVERQAIEILLKKDECIDLVIPRGGEELIRMVVEKSTIPVIKHYKGICHIYVSSRADLKKAMDIVVNAKVQRPGVCNAMETLLLDAGLPVDKRTAIINALLDKGVEIFGDDETMQLSSFVKKGDDNDWKTEYLDLRLAVKTVKNCGAAIDHINTYGSRHTDAIITESSKEAKLFINQVDSASVIVNASTRFSDGGEYGMGCEIGISTDKLHARGPMGIDDLTTYKWVVRGNGQICT